MELENKNRAEDMFCESRGDLHLALDSIPGLVAILAPGGEVEVVNRQIVEYCGQSVDELKNWGTNGTIHPEDLPYLADVFTRSIAAGVSYQVETRLRRFDGEYRWVVSRGTPLHDTSGRITCWYVLITDIDDTKRAESELRRAYGYLTQAQRLSKTGSFRADVLVDEHIWSEELYRIFEFEPGTKISVHAVRAILHPEDLPSFDTAFQQSAAEGKDFDHFFRITTSSGKSKHLHCFAHVTERIDGRPIFIGAIQDVTDRKVAEEALNSTRAELAHVTRIVTLNTLTASIAHEVNQPLAGIVTNANTCLRMLASYPPNLDGARATVQRTLRDADRASEVIKRLRAMFTRKQPIAEPVDLNEAAREVLVLSSSELQSCGVTLQTEFHEDLPTVRGDRVQLQQVIINLVRNASDAMRDINDRPRKLLIRTTRDENDCVCLTVQDSGMGFAPEAGNRLFQAFYTTKNDGMGIGLSVSRSIVENHNGRLWAIPNDNGPGATFSFSIPLSTDCQGNDEMPNS